MIRVKYNSERQYDSGFDYVLSQISDSIKNKDDDMLLMCVGDPGTGKTSLGLYAMEKYMGDRCDVKYIGLTREDFAGALKLAKDDPMPRFCMNDEANISKRDSLTKFNKDMIDLYYSIRGLQIFHWWNNPSLDMIDKPFIEERISGVIFIFTKTVNKPRLYYYFTKQKLLAMLEKYGNLKLTTIKKIAKKYAFYRGWFRPYNGPLWEPYMVKKRSRMNGKVDDFYMKYSNNKGTKYSRKNAMREFGVGRRTVQNYEKILQDTNVLKYGTDIYETPNGRVHYTEFGYKCLCDLMVKRMGESKKRHEKTIKLATKCRHIKKGERNADIQAENNGKVNV